MNRAEYQEECIKVYLREEYGDLDACDIEFVNSIKDAFRFGIQCADFMPKPELVDLSKVWHNASIEPERDALFIAEDNKGGLDAYCWTQKDDDWIEYACLFGLRRWAYMKDLLPKGGAL